MKKGGKGRNRGGAGFGERTPEEERQAAELVEALKAEHARGGRAALSAAVDALLRRHREDA